MAVERLLPAIALSRSSLHFRKCIHFFRRTIQVRSKRLRFPVLLTNKNNPNFWFILGANQVVTLHMIRSIGSS